MCCVCGLVVSFDSSDITGRQARKTYTMVLAVVMVEALDVEAAVRNLSDKVPGFLEKGP